MSSITKNRNYPVYASDDNSGTFLSFRTTIAGPGAGSAMVMIDKDISELFESVSALQEEGSSVETIGFTYLENEGCYVGGEAELKTKAILIFSIDDNSIEVETKLNIANSGAKYLKRHDYKGDYINVLNSELVANKQYLTYFDGEYYMLIGCVVNEGDASNMFVTGAEATERANIDDKDDFKTAFGKLRKWFSDFGEMAWKNSVANEDLNENSIADNKLVKIPGKTIKGNVLSDDGNVANLTAEEVREMINVSDSADNTQAAIDSAMEKDAIVDEDSIVIRDSSDNIVKRTKFSVIKATIKTYFDTLYSKISHTHKWEEITNTPTEFAPSSHTQAASTITGLSSVATSGDYGDLKNIPGTFKPSSHTHSKSEITDWPSKFPPETHSHSEYALANHTHEYMTASEVDSKIAAAIAAIPVYDGTVTEG